MRGSWYLIAGVALLFGCTRPPDEAAIRATITAMATAVEGRHSADVLAHVSEDFTGNGGEFDRAQVANLLRAQLLAARGIGVRLGRVDVDLSGDRATARFDAWLSDASGRWLAERSTNLRFVTGWRRERGEWRCYNAGWERSESK